MVPRRQRFWFRFAAKTSGARPRPRALTQDVVTAMLHGAAVASRADRVASCCRGRHEKTKKKRGTYKGGPIDMGSNSLKFVNSDSE